MMKNASIVLISLLLAAMFFSGCAQTTAPAPIKNVTTTTQTNKTTAPVNSSSGNQSGNPTPGNQSENQTIAAPAEKVLIEHFVCNPSTLAVTAGSTVTWMNNDSVSHQITGNFANSSMLSPNGTFNFTFTTPGIYSYTCGASPSMIGRIVVK